MGLAELKVQLTQLSSNKYVQGSKEFVTSNTLVAKFAFLILVLILFMLLFSLGSAIVSLFFSPKHNPILIDGMIDSTQMMVIPQDPSKKGAKPILRSNNQREGLEFTWSVWVNINGTLYNNNNKNYMHVFHKGNNTINTTGSGGGELGTNFPLNGPGLYITPRLDDNQKGNVAGFKIIMNTFKTIDEEITIKNIPLNKWVNVIIRVTKQGQLDVYISGTLVKRLKLDSVPRQNYGDVYVSLNGGFPGNTSSLRYFEKAIGTNQIQSIVDKGPNRTLVAISSSDGKNDTNKYISTRWYMQSAADV
jgi:hypothetical protein